MIYSLNGKLIYTDEKSAVVECGGVGFRCFTSHKTLAQLPKVNENVMLYTYMAVREDACDLYGFFDANELEFFKMIISVNGIGPKLGISILSDFTPEQVALYITSGDAKAIAKANGVGAKTAQRIVLELKDKISGSMLSGSADLSAVANVNTASGNASEAIEALIAIGFTQADASKCVARLDPSLAVEEMIKQALKSISNL